MTLSTSPSGPHQRTASLSASPQADQPTSATQPAGSSRHVRPPSLTTKDLDQPEDDNQLHLVTSPVLDDGQDDHPSSSTPKSAPSQRDRQRRINPWRRANKAMNTESSIDSPAVETPGSSKDSHHHQRPPWLSKTRETQSAREPTFSTTDSSSSWTGMLKGIMGRGHSDDSDVSLSSAGHSRHTSREYKETLDAQTKDEKDGTRIINQYHLVKAIGQGTYGVVYKACLRDDSSQLFAVKEFSKTRLKKVRKHEKLRRPPMRGRPSAGGLRGRGLGHTPGASDRDQSTGAASSTNSGPSEQEAEADPLRLIRREIAIMKKLDHPNLIGLLEALDDPSRDELYMVVEFCPDGPVIDVKLHERTKPLHEDVARNYFVQVLLGIEYLHHNDIIHRDIKPDNVLLCDKRQTCKIVDFGVSQMFDQSDTSARLKGQGTPAFLSPELCSAAGPSASSTAEPLSPETAEAVRQQREFSGRRDDVWAFGVTFYCMVVGHLPFDKSNFLELYDAIKEQEPEYPSHLSADCVDLLKRFLNKDPSKRISAEEIRQHQWVTQGGKAAVLSVADNLKNAVHDITEAEIQSAIARISSVWTVARAVSKFKLAKARGSTRSASTQSQSSDVPVDGASSSYFQEGATPTDSPLQSPSMSRSNTGPGNSVSGLLSEFKQLNIRRKSLAGGQDSVGDDPTLSSQASPRTTSHNIQSPISESPEIGDQENRDAEDSKSLLTGALGTAASGVYDKVASLAQNVVGEPLQQLQGQAAEANSSTVGSSMEHYSKAMSDALADTLRRLESELEQRMRRADPVAAKKHLADAIQQYPPLDRLQKGLKGMGLNLFGWAEGRGESGLANARKQDGSTAQREELKASSAAAADAADEIVHACAGDQGTGNDSKGKSREDTKLPARLMEEDEEGVNIHTGRTSESGPASSGATRLRHERPQSGPSEKEEEDDSEGLESSPWESSGPPTRLFDGPLIASPHRDEEYVSRASAARDLSSDEASASDRESAKSGAKVDDSHGQGGPHTNSKGEKSLGGNLPEKMKHEEIDTTSSENASEEENHHDPQKTSSSRAGEKQGAAD